MDLGLVRDAQLSQEDGDLPRVGRRAGAVEDNRLERHVSLWLNEKDLFRRLRQAGEVDRNCCDGCV